MKEVEEWSGMKVGNIIFDSDIDNWNVDTSVFDQRIINKSNLIFLIEDGYDNKFGGYIKAKIYICQEYIHDPNFFLFSLKSNGRLNGMMRFDTKKEQYSFLLCGRGCIDLFLFGHDWWDHAGGGHEIKTQKETNKGQSYCKQESYNFTNNENALCGNTGKQNPFTPKRIVIVQLIFDKKIILLKN